MARRVLGDPQDINASLTLWVHLQIQTSSLELLTFNEPLNRVAAVKVREILKLIEADGWFLDRTRGSHRQYKHFSKPGLVTVPGKPGEDLARGTLNSILKQAPN